MANNIYDQIGSSFGGLAASLVTNEDFIEAINSCIDTPELDKTASTI
jgi:hypothetical protein